MAREHRETERKYEGFALPAGLGELPGVTATREAEPQDLAALYYDTSDLRLLRRGIAVRRRTGGGDAGWHVKLPLGADARHEVHLPLGTGGPREVPAEFSGRLAAFTRGAALLPVAHLRTHRVRTQLLDRRSQILAEVSEDRVASRTFDLTAAGATPARAGPTQGGEVHRVG
ncbi:CYTH domain-containing protein [Kitasatospora purpeofusca]|uniref:CYTH domain-containing protein n=1 Tax=Kitasatospora purpeofusca TaxID=67352 RepID=UPI0036CA8517